jgi:hypothetical protein
MAGVIGVGLVLGEIDSDAACVAGNYVLDTIDSQKARFNEPERAARQSCNF